MKITVWKNGQSFEVDQPDIIEDEMLIEEPMLTSNERIAELEAKLDAIILYQTLTGEVFTDV